MRFDQPISSDKLIEALIHLCRASAFRTAVHIRMMAFIDGLGALGAKGPVGTAITALPRDHQTIRRRRFCSDQFLDAHAGQRHARTHQSQCKLS